MEWAVGQAVLNPFKNISLLFGCIGPSLWCVGSFVAVQDSVAVVCELGCSTACMILVPLPGIEPMSAAFQCRF